MTPRPEETQLSALPPPSRSARTFTLVMLTLTFCGSCIMVAALQREARFAFAPPAPSDAGSLATAKLESTDRERFVRAKATLDTGRAIRFNRRGESTRYQLAPVAGSTGKRRWVQFAIPAGIDAERFVAPSRVSGRLTVASDLGIRYRGLTDALRKAGVSEPESAWILVDGATPKTARWVLGLTGLMAAFALWSMGSLLRLIRPVASDPEIAPR